jgi:hypothetical protein
MGRTDMMSPASGASPPYIDGCLRPGPDPIADASRWLDATLAGRPVPDLLIVIGLGQGHLLDLLDQRGLGTRVLGLEPEPLVAKAFFRRRDWSVWQRSGRLVHLTGPDFAGADEAWRLVPDRPDGRLLLVHPLLSRDGGEAAVRAARTLKQILVGAEANAEARRRFAPRYLLNTLRNLPAIVSGGDVAGLFDAFSGVPAVITAAGPSLDDTLDELRRVEGRALLIAVDTTLPALIGAGLAPHLAVGVDPSEGNARHLMESPSCEQTLIVAEGSLDPRAIDPFADRTFFLRVGESDPWPWLLAHGIDRGRLRTWGSVLTTALDLAVRAGCDPIVFAGADLAFTGDRPYCRGTVYEKGWAVSVDLGYELAFTWRSEVDARHPIEAVDLHGRPTRTSTSLQAFRDWIVSQSHRLADRRLVNVSPAGILYGGRIERGSLADVLPARSFPGLRDDLRSRLVRLPDRVTSRYLGRLRRDLAEAAHNGLAATWSASTTAPRELLEAQLAEIAVLLGEGLRGTPRLRLVPSGARTARVDRAEQG